MKNRTKFPDVLKDPCVKQTLNLVGYLGKWNRLSDSINEHINTINKHPPLKHNYNLNN